MGKRISVALLIVIAVGLTVISMELVNIWEWMFRPHVQRRRDILKKRKERLHRQKRMFGVH